MMEKKMSIPAKGRYKCFLCKIVCAPKDGDWFDAHASGGGNQVFICRGCEREFKASAQKQ